MKNERLHSPFMIHGLHHSRSVLNENLSYRTVSMAPFVHRSSAFLLLSVYVCSLASRCHCLPAQEDTQLFSHNRFLPTANAHPGFPSYTRQRKVVRLRTPFRLNRDALIKLAFSRLTGTRTFEFLSARVFLTRRSQYIVVFQLLVAKRHRPHDSSRRPRRSTSQTSVPPFWVSAYTYEWVQCEGECEEQKIRKELRRKLLLKWLKFRIAWVSLVPFANGLFLVSTELRVPPLVDVGLSSSVRLAIPLVVRYSYRGSSVRKITVPSSPAALSLRSKECKLCFSSTSRLACSTLIQRCEKYDPSVHIYSGPNSLRSKIANGYIYLRDKVGLESSVYCAGFWRSFVASRKADCDMNVGGTYDVAATGISLKMEANIARLYDGLSVVSQTLIFRQAKETSLATSSKKTTQASRNTNVKSRLYKVALGNVSHAAVNGVSRYPVAVQIRVRYWKNGYAAALRKATASVARQNGFRRLFTRKTVKRTKKYMVLRFKFKSSFLNEFGGYGKRV